MQTSWRNTRQKGRLSRRIVVYSRPASKQRRNLDQNRHFNMGIAIMIG
jgi:hypothetical protein